jgi:purine-binding chemotaxis protein CheW
VREVMRRCAVERVESAPNFTLGLALIRGESVPVVDAGVLLTGQACEGARFVVLRVSDRRVALAVDEVLGARRIDAGELGRLPPLLAGAQDLVRAIAVLDGRLVDVLESGRLIEAVASDLVASGAAPGISVASPIDIQSRPDAEQARHE